MNSAVSDLRPHCSPMVKFILFFYSIGAHFLLLCLPSFSFPVSSLSPFLCSLSLSARRLPLRWNLGQSIKPSRFFFYSLNALSVLYLSLSSLTSFFSLLSLCFTNVVRQWVGFANDCAPAIMGCRWLWSDDCGHGSWVRGLWSDGGNGGFFSFFFSFFFFVMLGSSWVRLGSDRAMEPGGQPWSTGQSVDRRSRGSIWLIWFVGFFLAVGCGPI